MRWLNFNYVFSKSMPSLVWIHKFFIAGFASNGNILFVSITFALDDKKHIFVVRPFDQTKPNTVAGEKSISLPEMYKFAKVFHAGYLNVDFYFLGASWGSAAKNPLDKVAVVVRKGHYDICLLCQSQRCFWWRRSHRALLSSLRSDFILLYLSSATERAQYTSCTRYKVWMNKRMSIEFGWSGSEIVKWYKQKSVSWYLEAMIIEWR